MAERPAIVRFFDCIFRIPCCGGFCAPTKNPDPSCFKHLSNEYTLPAADFFIKAAPICEHSPCCIACGKFGCAAIDKRRKQMALFAAIVTFIGFLLTIWSALAISNNPNLIKLAYWSRGIVQIPALGKMPTKEVLVYIGLNARLEVVSCEEDDACTTVFQEKGYEAVGDRSYEKLVMWSDEAACLSDECESCKGSALEVGAMMISSCITYWPQFLTDMQRSTHFGDVNCQSFMGALTSMVPGTLLTLAAMLDFRLVCFKHMPKRIEGFEVSWALGPGFICLIVACALKLIDMAYHLSLPTPSVRWQKPTSLAATDTVEYLLLAAPAQYEPL